MLDQLTKFQPPLPPNLSDYIGIVSQNRFIKLTYELSKPFWSDGTNGATFSYYAVFQPFIEHPAIAINLLDENIDLGTDDTEPTHAILLDRKEDCMYVGEVSVVKNILKNHQEILPNLPEPDWSKWEEISQNHPQRIGMFESMIGISDQQHLEAINLIQWLDHYISDDLINRLIKAEDKGFGKAYYILAQFTNRLDFSNYDFSSAD